MRLAHLATAQVAEGRVGALILGNGHGGEVVALVDGATIESDMLAECYAWTKGNLLRDELLGLVVGNILDVAEDVTEWRDNEVVVVGERSLVDIEADTASVAEDDAGLVLTGLVDYNGRNGRLDDALEDVALIGERSTVHAPRLRSTAIDLAQLELVTKLGDVASDSLTRVIVESLILLAGVVDEGVAVPVEVAARPLEDRVGSLLGGAAGVGNAMRVLDALEAAVGGVKARQGNPAKGLAVATRLKSNRVLVVDGKVADVAVAAKDRNGSVGVDLADGFENGLQGVGVVVLADRVVAN